MHNRIAAFLERVALCNTFESLLGEVVSLRDFFQVDHVVYHSVKRDGEPFALATYGAEWANYYESEELYRIDPVVLSAFQRFRPYSWKSLKWDSKTARKFLVDAIDGGVGNQGISIPIRGPHGEFALFSLSHSCSDPDWAKLITNARNDLPLVAHFLHQAARRIEASGHQRSYTNLSPREGDALRLLGNGLKRGRVAEQLKISEHTLRVYIESARTKLGATNTTHAVAKALSDGVIPRALNFDTGGFPRAIA